MIRRARAADVTTYWDGERVGSAAAELKRTAEALPRHSNRDGNGVRTERSAQRYGGRMKRLPGWAAKELKMERLCIDAAREGRPFQRVRLTICGGQIRLRRGGLVNCGTAVAR